MSESVRKAVHMAGTELVADGLSKALQGQSFGKFVQKLGPMQERTGAACRSMNATAVDGPWKLAPWLAVVGCSLMDVNLPVACLLFLLTSCLWWRDKKDKKECEKNEQEPKRTGGRAISAQDDVPESGRVTPKKSAQEGREASPV